jgi:hypothetical protein
VTQSDQLSTEDLLSYMRRTSMQYAHKALLAVQMAWSDNDTFTTRDFAGFLSRFYCERNQRGLRLEKPEKQPALTLGEVPTGCRYSLPPLPRSWFFGQRWGEATHLASPLQRRSKRLVPGVTRQASSALPRTARSGGRTGEGGGSREKRRCNRARIGGRTPAKIKAS